MTVPLVLLMLTLSRKWMREILHVFCSEVKCIIFVQFSVFPRLVNCDINDTYCSSIFKAHLNT